MENNNNKKILVITILDKKTNHLAGIGFPVGGQQAGQGVPEIAILRSGD